MENTIIPSKLTRQDARDFGFIDAEIEMSINFMRDMLDSKDLFYVKDDFTRKFISKRLKGLKDALYLKRNLFENLNNPKEL